MYRKIISILGWITLFAILYFAYWIIHLQNIKDISQGAPVEISFLELKEDADCILIQQGKLNVLIDTGKKQDAQKVVNYLQEKDVSSIEYLILTHPDKDHIGSTLDILDNFEVKNIIQPYYPKNNEDLKKLNDKANTNGIRIIYPTLTRKFSIAEMDLLIYPPLEKNYEKDNNYSLVTLVKHGKVSMLFTGDSEKKRIEELLLVSWTKVDLCKIPCHGRANMNSQQFIRATQPTYAVITSNDADEIIKETCEELNTKLFYTGLGDKVFYSDGKILMERNIPNK
ncbi:MAG: MBL fold metallo-hydrolase [Oscillospiraceae bacterium]